MFQSNSRLRPIAGESKTQIGLRSCFKILQLARYGVTNRLEMLIYSCVNCAFSPIYALSRTHPRNLKQLLRVSADQRACIGLNQTIGCDGRLKPVPFGNQSMAYRMVCRGIHGDAGDRDESGRDKKYGQHCQIHR
jgi:hypothetical protein